MELEMYRKYSQMARGIEKAELVFKNGRVFSSGTGEFIDGDVAVADGIVIGVGTYKGEKEIDLEGKVICPGFIDSHLHLESTLVTPGELVRQAAQCGTTTFIVDPHESANVSGTDGIDYILDQTEKVPANVYVMMPSCVPAMHRFWHLVICQHMYLEGLIQIMSVWTMSMQCLKQEMGCMC